MELWPEWPAGGGGGQYPAGGDGGGHVGGYPAMGDPPHDIMGVGAVWETSNMKVWLMLDTGVGSRDHRVRWDTDHMRRGMQTAQITLLICY
jgi:hypothetical protein